MADLLNGTGRQTGQHQHNGVFWLPEIISFLSTVSLTLTARDVIATGTTARVVWRVPKPPSIYKPAMWSELGQSKDWAINVQRSH